MKTLDDILSHITNESLLKKNIVIAKALARDYSETFSVETVALESEPGRRRKRDGMPADTGVFIRTKMFKVSWYKFRSFKHADNFRWAATKCISAAYENLKAITNCSLDVGILECIQILKKEECKFYHTLEAYKSLQGHVTGKEYSI